MAFLSDQIDSARKAGYSDDEIASHLYSKDKSVAAAMDAGYGIGDIYAHSQAKSKELDQSAQHELDIMERTRTGDTSKDTPWLKQQRQRIMADTTVQEASPALQQVVMPPRDTLDKVANKELEEAERKRNIPELRATPELSPTQKVVKTVRDALSPFIGATPEQSAEMGSATPKYVREGVLPILEKEFFSKGILSALNGGELQKYESEPGDSAIMSFRKAGYNTLVSLADAISTPENIALGELGATKFAGAAGKYVPKAVGAAFGTQMLYGAQDQLRSAWNSDNPQEKIEGYVGGLMSLAFSAMAFRGAFKEGAITPEQQEIHRNEIRATLRDGNIPTEHLQEFALNPDFAKTWGQDISLIHAELARRSDLPSTARTLDETPTATKEAQPAPQEPASANAQLGTRQGEQARGEGSKAQPRIVAATYTNPETGAVSTGKNHIEAASQQEVAAPQERTARETPEYGFQLSDGRVVTREEAAQLARENGQLPADSPIEKLHSDNVEMGVAPDAATIERQRAGLTEADVTFEEPKPVAENGPGAAHVSDFPGQQTFSNKNSVVDQERAKRGLEPIAKPAKKELGKTWDDAETELNQNPHRGEELVNELTRKPRAVTDTEEAILLQHGISLSNEIKMDMDRAADENLSLSEREEAQVRASANQDKFDALNQATKAAGTEWGRAGKFRQQLANEDFTLAPMLQRKRIAKGDKLTPEEEAHVKKLSDKIAELEKKLAERQRKTSTKSREQAVGDEVESIKKRVAGKKVERDLNAENSSIIDGLSKRLGNGENVSNLRSYIQKLAENFVRQGINKVEPLVNAVHNVLSNISPEITREQTMDLISGYGDYKSLSQDAIKIQLRDLKGQMQQLGKIADMQKGAAPKRTGTERRNPSDEERRLIKTVNELKKKGGFSVTDPATQLRSALDAIKTRLKNQIKDLATRFDTGEKPFKKGSVPYDAEADRLKAARDRIAETLRNIEGKPEMTDEQRIKIATDHLEKSIKDYEERIKNKDFEQRSSGSKTPDTPELEALRSRRDALKEEFDHLKSIDAALKEQRESERLQASIYKLEQQLESGNISPRQRERTVDTEEVARWRRQKEELIQKLKERRDALKPKKTKEEIALQAFKVRTANRIAELQERITNKDFAPRKKVSDLKLDKEALSLKEQAERAKLDFRREVEKDRLSNQSRLEKVLFGIAKWNRAFILSSPTTLAKLSSAAAEIMAITPVENAIGAGFGKILPKAITEGAARRGNFNLRIEAKAIAETWKNLLRDFGDEVKTGHMDIDVLYGKPELFPPELKDYIGHIHGALKSPAKRNEFIRSMEYRLQNAAERGIDITDPMVQTRIGNEAYIDANKAIFREDNFVVSAYNRALRSLSEKDKGTGRVSWQKVAADFALKYSLPIVRIPTNIVARTLEYSFGTISGSTRLVRAAVRGFDTLTPGEKDIILQNFARGSLGLSFVLIGFFNPENVGGYYQRGQKRDEKDVKEGGVRIHGVDIPRYLVHNPLLEQLQIGATIRRVADSFLRKKDVETQGVTSGVLAAYLGLLKEVPFIRGGETVSNLMNSRDAGEAVKKIAGSNVQSLVPLAVQGVARYMDKDEHGETVKRKPENLWQYLESGIPGLRKNVPVKPEPKKSSRRDIRSATRLERRNAR